MTRIVVDSDVASRLFKDTLPGPLYGKLAGHQLAVTFVTVGEMTRWALVRDWGDRRRGELSRWLDAKTVIPGDRDVAKIWGEIVTYANKRGRPRPVNDSWIAACCLTYGLPLATLNVADFQDFADHEGLELITL